jgi:hypothetical protein
MRMRTLPATLLSVAFMCITASTAAAQKSKGVDGKTACGLMSADDVKHAAGRTDVARKTSHMDEDTDVSSNCQYWGAVDITLHIGKETKVMFGRMRDTYVKAPARLGYVVERISGLGDDAYYLVDKNGVQVRALRGETELAVSLSGSVPPTPEAKNIALNIAKATLAKL